jgi:hypothetical protein
VLRASPARWGARCRCRWGIPSPNTYRKGNPFAEHVQKDELGAGLLLQRGGGQGQRLTEGPRLLPIEILDMGDMASGFQVGEAEQLRAQRHGEPPGAVRPHLGAVQGRVGGRWIAQQALLALGHPRIHARHGHRSLLQGLVRSCAAAPVHAGQRSDSPTRAGARSWATATGGHIPPGRDPDDPLEVPGQMGLVVEAGLDRGLGDR